MGEKSVAKEPVDKKSVDERSVAKASATESQQPFQRCLDKAVACSKQSRWDEAIAHYREALMLQPDTQQAWIYVAVGQLMMKKEQVDKAIVSYKKAIAIAPEMADAYVHLGFALEKKQLTSEAIASYRRATSLSPVQPPWVYEQLSKRLRKRAKQDYRLAIVSDAHAMYLQDRLSCFDRLSDSLEKTYGSLGVCTKQDIRSLYLEAGNKDQKSAGFTSRLAAFGFLSPQNTPVNPAGYYLINENLKTVYCSIPKNACTLFKTMMVDNSPLKESFEASGLGIHDFLSQRIEDIGADYLLECLNSPDYFKFAILRNPFDRAVSGYLDKFAKHVVPEAFVQDIILNVQTSLGLAKDIEKSITFSQFVDYLARTPDQDLNDHWRSQHSFISTVGFDFIGQFEKMPSVIASLENVFGINIQKKVSSHITQYKQFESLQDFQNMYPQQLRSLEAMPNPLQLATGEVRRKLNSRYRRDIARYKHEFDLDI